MAHIRCKHCGLETEDDTVLACPHKSTCRTRGKDEDYLVLGKKSAQAPRPIQATATTSPKKTTSKGGKKSRK